MLLPLVLSACASGADDTAAGGPLPNLVVNEFLAANVSINTDAAGEYDDWVEIYNFGDRAVSFAGLYLTDDRDASPTRWAFPEGGTLAPGAFVLFWCDATSTQGSDHTTFALEKNGEQISIFYAAGGAEPALVDGVDFPAQSADLSFARVPDGGIDWLQGTPTPGVSNG